MDNAILSSAWLQSAILNKTNLQNAKMYKTRLQEAEIQNALLQGTNLMVAQFQGANLTGTPMQGTVLMETLMQGVLLRDSRMSTKTSLVGAHLRGAAIENVDFTNVTLKQPQVDETFGDGSVTLPPDLTRPAHWPTEVLEWHEFLTQWRAWQKSIGFDPGTPGD